MSKCLDCRIKYPDRQNFCHYCGLPLAKGKVKLPKAEETDSYERGVIYELRGEIFKAQKEFSTLLKINRRDADAYYQLGKICEQNGQSDKALRLYQKCLACDKDKKWEEELKHRIKNLKRPEQN